MVGGLRHVSGRTLGKRFVGGAGVLVAGQEHHLRAQPVALDGADDLEAVEAGHPDVDDGDVRLELVDPLEGLAAVGGRADELEVGALADRPLEALAIDRMIVRDQDRQPSGAHRHDSRTEGGGSRRAGPLNRTVGGEFNRQFSRVALKLSIGPADGMSDTVALPRHTRGTNGTAEGVAAAAPSLVGPLPSISVDQPEPHRPGNGSGAIGDVELLVGVMEMRLDRRVAEVEPAGDVGDRAALGGQGEDLALALAQLDEGAEESVAAVDGLDRVERVAAVARLVLEAEVEVAAAPARAPLVGDDPCGDRVEPWQRRIGKALALAPGDRERLRGRVLGRLPAGDAAHREGEDVRVVVAEAALEALAPGILARARAVVGRRHLE